MYECIIPNHILGWLFLKSKIIKLSFEIKD